MTSPLKDLLAQSHDLPSVPVARVRRLALCLRCRTPVAAVGTYCPECGPTAIRESRIALLGAAASTLPRDFEFASFGHRDAVAAIVGAEALRETQAALEAPRITLQGPAGSGKTTLAVALARSVLEIALDPECSVEQWRRAEGCRFLSSYDLARAVSEHPLGQGSSPMVKAALEASLLVLDDLGAEPRIHTSAVADVIYDRHAKGKQTVVTTGFDEARLAERYGDGIARRLLERTVLIHLEAA